MKRTNFFFEIDKENVDIGYMDHLSYHKHLHPYIEFGYLYSGQTKLCVDNKEYILSAGDAYCILPYQLHSFEDLPDEKTFQSVSFIFADTLVPSFKRLFAYNRLETSKMAMDENELQPVIDKIFEWYQKRELKYRDMCIGGYLTILLSLFFENVQFLTDEKGTKIDVLRKILDYCNEHFRENISLDIISDELGFSKSYISATLNNRLGIGVIECINQLRIQEATALFDAGNSRVTEVAFECGFKSVRSFNRNFTKYVGTAPKDYIMQKNGTESK